MIDYHEMNREEILLEIISLKKQIADYEVCRDMDLREQKKTEAALIRSRKNLRQIIDLVPNSISARDADGKFILANKTLAERFGMSPDQLVGKYFSDVSKDKGLSEKHLAEDNKVIEQGRAKYIPDFKYTDRNGKIHWLQAIKVPYRHDNKTGVLIVEVDITSLKEYQRRLKQLTVEQDVLLLEVNHRVKNNLSAIIGMLHKEQDRAESLKMTESAAILEGIISRIQGLASVHSLLTESQWKPLNLGRLCHQIIRSAAKINSFIHSVDIEISKTSILIDSNQAHNIALVMNELATNSAKYAIGDRGSLSIFVDIQNDSNGIRIIYKDNGSGYPEKFIQGNRNLEGVGMEIIRGIVTHSMNGEVRFYNDGGAVVEICIPEDLN